MRAKRLLTSLILGLGLTLAFLLLLNGKSVTLVYADDYTVSNTNASGPGSLRQAIEDSNVDPDHDTIDFATNVSGTIVLTAPLVIDYDLTIDGPGADELAVSGADSNRVFLIKSGSAVTITDLSIQDGRASGSADGGGLLVVEDSSLALSGTRVISNWAGRSGGGLCVGSGSATLTGTQVVNNSAGDRGGGLYVGDGSAMLAATQVVSNSAYLGGGVFASGAEITLLRSEILSNTAASEGGVGLSGSSAEMINNVIADNTRLGFPCAGGVGVFSSTATLVHNTFARNRGTGASAVYVEGDGPDASVVTLTNNIVVSHAKGIVVNSGSTATLQATLWGAGSWANDDGWDGDGHILTGTVNIWADPGFVDADARDYRIGIDSVAVDQGVETDVTNDIDNDARAGVPDIGAHEYGMHIYLPLVLRGAGS